MRLIRISMVVVCALFSANAFATPEIYCEQPLWDFGVVTDAASLTNRFLISNRGDSSLLITEVDSSCGCTVASLTDKQLAPNESVPLTVIFNPKNRSGKQHKTLRIHSNDPQTPVYDLQLAGHVNPSVVCMPPAIIFIIGSSEGLVERTLTLTYDRPVEIKSIDIESEAITAKSVSEGRAKSHVIKVRIDPQQFSGRFRSALTVTTDHPVVPQKNIPVLGHIED